MLEVTVVRKDWFRGKGGDESKLQIAPTGRVRDNNAGKKCCLGFGCLAAGQPVEDIIGEADPSGIANPTELVKKHMLDTYGNLLPAVESMIQINDRIGIEDSDREYRLIGLGKDVGIAFTFVD